MDIRHLGSATAAHPGRVSALTALAAAVLALAAASPAGAETNTSSPPKKKACSLEFAVEGGGYHSLEYDHGSTFTTKDKTTGKTRTYTCNDGKWTEKAGPAGAMPGVALPSGSVRILDSGVGRLDVRVKAAAFRAGQVAARP